ncbi:hypothetical protein F5X68DRAFT_228300 [Plectosphaerella plurivora]|uniref:FAD/NAD(P)-binding domain-containing protein n=1 Tax=Plectosphaerella plurivora TaxID=936078 RepID=A0A9P9AE48_9PEZI|nr:hypothetical protein F5X68DRAFT_228300 [Plectosphaerella plurivora]
MSSSSTRGGQVLDVVHEPSIGDTTPGVEFFFTLRTSLATGRGVCRLAEDQGKWKIFTLYTRINDLNDCPRAIGPHRPKGVEHGGQPGRKNWNDRRRAAVDFENGQEPVALIIGAGQAGLTAAARLKMLGIETLMVDQNERIGDNWRQRYHQLVLHDPIWYDHTPYLPFPESWPIFTPKDKLAQFFEAYATLLELNVWTRSTISNAEWNPDTRSWTVIVTRRKSDGTTEERTLHPRHIIQATGHSGKKYMPEMRGVENFRGDRLCHSSGFTGALDQGPKGASNPKKAVVVGSCNSAHDIAQDFLEKGYHVTIVQRSSTHVLSSSALTDILLKPAYSEGGPTVDDADMLIHGLPLSVLKARHIEVFKRVSEYDSEMLQGLEKAGFKTDTGHDGAGLLFKYFQRGGGYYIDVGASKLIADGKIHVNQGREIAKILPRGIRFEDGTELDADEIVFATGYQNMRTQTRAMFGDKLADAVKDVWGLNHEGEMRTMWQDSGHPGFWFHGGNLALCRYYSEFLALQIKGLEEGIYAYGEC